MPTFRLIYFRASLLDHAETIEAPDALSAIHEAAARPSEGLVELWSDNGKLATFRPAIRHRFE